MALVLGLNAKLYRNTATWVAPVWVEIGNVRDLTLNLETAEADVTTRTNNGWRATVATLKDASIEYEMVWDTTDANFTAVKDAFLANSFIDFNVLDGDILVSGNQGLRAEMMISTFSRNEALEDALKATVNAKPTFSVNAPVWFIVP